VAGFESITEVIQEALKKDIADLRAVVDALDHAFQKEWIRVDWRKGARDS
jgi:hypothetical protein